MVKKTIHLIFLFFLLVACLDETNQVNPSYSTCGEEKGKKSPPSPTSGEVAALLLEKELSTQFESSLKLYRDKVDSVFSQKNWELLNKLDQNQKFPALSSFYSNRALVELIMQKEQYVDLNQLSKTCILLKDVVNRQIELGKKLKSILLALESYYTEGEKSKLLIGTVNQVLSFYTRQISDKAVDLSLEEVQKKFKEIYRAQCDVTRENWLKHLGVIGEKALINRKPLILLEQGQKEIHYTIYKNCICKKENISVFGKNSKQISDELFNFETSTAQIHATVKIGEHSYHKYWDKIESLNVQQHNLKENQPKVYKLLEEEYQRMKEDILKKIQIVIDYHGRIGNNERAQQAIKMLLTTK